MQICLPVTCHDPLGAFAEGIGRAADARAATFDAITVNATTETASSTLHALAAYTGRVTIETHPAGSIGAD